MPELPDIVVYLEALEARTVGRTVEAMRFASPFVLRTVSPSPSEFAGRRVNALRRIGKRIVLEIEGELFVVIHLMIAGRLRWEKPKAKIPGKVGLAAIDFENGSLILTEASGKKRASIHLISGESQLRAIDRGGAEVLDLDVSSFGEILRRENHTVKRALTDPRLFSGIGNAYSDEILHRARLSPVKLTSRLSDHEVATLHRATIDTLEEWIERLRRQAGARFPEKVTAFREEMAVHGRYGQPCPVCGTAVQRIVYADNETNYCPRCQTGGKLLADRALSRLLHGDWPKNIEEIE